MALHHVVLRQALEELDYVDGKNVTYTGQWAEAKSERLPGMAAELVRLPVDLLVTTGGPEVGRSALRVLISARPSAFQISPTSRATHEMPSDLAPRPP